MHTNGLGHKTIGMHPGAFRNALRNVPQPNMVGAGMVLSARGGVYEGTVPAAIVAKRRARNKAARIARRNGRR